jgi:DNA (cytosine-5)-methyltransferase 1
MNALSLFSGIGVDEFFLPEIGVNVVLANEIVKARAEAYSLLHDNKNIIQADICDQSVKEKIISVSKKEGVDLVLATPPCQGLSRAGANRSDESISTDKRNFLVMNAIEIVEALKPSYFIIENVPRFAKMVFPFNEGFVSLENLLKSKFGLEYNINVRIFDAADLGVPQSRLRIVYRMWKKGLRWALPVSESKISLEQAIGFLPSLESGQGSLIKNHFARKHPKNQIEWMRHTPTGHSAFENNVFFPKKTNGERISGYGNTYMRMRWDKPAPTITMRNECISSQENVHPGRPSGDGTWSDARVLTLRELLIVSSLPADLDIPSNMTETAFRQVIGEGIPPLMLKKILEGIGK